MEDSTLFKERFQPGLEQILGDRYALYVYIDGEFVKGEDAKISVWDRSVRFGDGVFEGMRVYNNKIFKLDEHVDRLIDSCKYVGITRLPLDKKEICTVAKEAVRRNGLEDAYIRINVSRGIGLGGLDPTTTFSASIVVMVYPLPLLLGEKPVKMITSTVRKKSPQAVDARAKTLNYLDSILAKLQAVGSGVEEAVMLDTNSFIAEGTGENIFIVKGGKLYTPFTVAALAGITRATVFELCKELGLAVQEQNLTLFDLYTADEVFLTGTGAGIVAVCEVDSRKIGDIVPGPMTMKIADAYEKCVHERHLTPVYEN